VYNREVITTNNYFIVYKLKKLILFALTWRDNNDGYYQFTQKDLNLLSDFFDKNNCIIGVREHFNHKNKSYYNQLKK
jgi:CDP-glycerol glycerophosphotransferase (TagB/SpsB family)